MISLSLAFISGKLILSNLMVRINNKGISLNINFNTVSLRGAGFLALLGIKKSKTELKKKQLEKDF